jgi:SAM-dependent methyltransferase
MFNSKSESWNAEYENASSFGKGITSSTRTTPSSAAQNFQLFLTKNGISSGRLAELGCGNGRNTIFYAQNGFNVTAVDFSQAALNELRKKVRLEDASSTVQLTPATTITLVNQYLSEDWCFAQDNQYDAVSDTFCFKHIIEPHSREVYRSELLRTLKVSGYFLLNLAALDDGYYSDTTLCPVVENSQYNEQKSEDKILHIQDSQTKDNIESLIYSYDTVIRFFTVPSKEGQPAFQLVRHEHLKKESEMHGENFQRSIHRFIFKKISS